MNVSRGDVVLVDFPFASGGAAKVRPALVVQTDANNQRLVNTIVAMITGRTQRASLEPTQLLIDVTTPDGRQSGLRTSSAVNCANLFTVNQQKILRKIGSLSPAVMQKVNLCLKASLDLP
jgi:mRNA interferase MazF